MEAVLLVIHLIVALGIIILVLLQPAESGGFLGQGGSMSNMLAPRRSGDIMTRMTGIFAALFFITSLSLAFVATKSAPESSILDELETPAAATQAVTDEDAAAVSDETPVAPIAGESDVVTPAAPTATDAEPTAPIAP